MMNLSVITEEAREFNWPLFVCFVDCKRRLILFHTTNSGLVRLVGVCGHDILQMLSTVLNFISVCLGVLVL